MSCPYECYQNCLRCISGCYKKDIYEQLKNVPDNYVIDEDYPEDENETMYDEDYESLGLADCLPEDF